MLDVAAEREVEGDLCLHDLGHGLPIRPGTVDGAISISAVQWLCNAVRPATAQRGHAGGPGRACMAAWLRRAAGQPRSGADAEYRVHALPRPVCLQTSPISEQG